MENNKPAGFWIQFLASVLDSIFIAILTWIIATVINDQVYFNPSMNIYETSISKNLSSLIYTVVFMIIFTSSKFMGSPGKLICGIKIVNPDMTQISIWKSLGRVFAYIISAIPFLIGFMMAGWNREKKALHDMICSTRVVYRNK